MQQPLPPPTVPIVGPGGMLNEVWYRVIQALYNRTGGATGTPPAPVFPDLTALQSIVGDINTNKIPALQQSISDFGLLAATADDAVPAAPAVIDLSALNDLRVLALTQED